MEGVDSLLISTVEGPEFTVVHEDGGNIGSEDFDLGFNAEVF